MSTCHCRHHLHTVHCPNRNLDTSFSLGLISWCVHFWTNHCDCTNLVYAHWKTEVDTELDFMEILSWGQSTLQRAWLLCAVWEGVLHAEEPFFLNISICSLNPKSILCVVLKNGPQSAESRTSPFYSSCGLLSYSTCFFFLMLLASL